jgi:hypothetical protein
VSADPLAGLWSPLVTRGVPDCVSNLAADVLWLDDGVREWRVARTQPMERNCYVASATGQFLDYGREEIRRLDSRAMQAAARAALLPLAPALRALDPIVILDALPVSTVLHAEHGAASWTRALHAVRRRFPRDPIVVRSLDARSSPRTMRTLEACGLQMVPSRLVFHQDPRDRAFWRIRNIRHDLALMASDPLPVRPLDVRDAPDIARLYWQLYGGKHSTLNPHFTPLWITLGMADGVLRGEGIELDGALVAVYLAYEMHGWMTNPIFGYDLSVPQRRGLYRRLSLLTAQRAQQDGLQVHASSGAPGFKASRGGVPSMEYHAVDTRGARVSARAAWWLTRHAAMRLAPTLLAHAT